MGQTRTYGIVTWNVAAINNNPFEYWIDHPDPKYGELMAAVASFISEPGDRDIPVSVIFTPAMYEQLHTQMATLGWEGLDETRKLYNEDFCLRTIINGFLKDRKLGKKRLASWPDRMTNTIVHNTKGNICRPTVINCYDEPLKDIKTWFEKWLDFMFSSKVGPANERPCELLSKIKKSKYPDITEEEERISLPLQTLALGIFDAIEVHIMNSSGISDWLNIKRSIMQTMNLNKTARIIGILESYTNDTTVFCLQECGKALLTALHASEKISAGFHIVNSAMADPKRDQNSLILLSKTVFGPEIVEHSATCFEHFPKGQRIPIAPGDLLVISAPTVVGGGNKRIFLGSFHGDTQGLASVPVLHAVTAALKHLDCSAFIFGIDANVYEEEKEGHESFKNFVKVSDSLGLETTWGERLSSSNYTTFNARTYVQPQLNKAAAFDDIIERGDRNPKDFILVSKNTFKNFNSVKDNTGQRKYIEGVLFPSLKFPSDHGLIFSSLDHPPQGVSK